MNHAIFLVSLFCGLMVALYLFELRRHKYYERRYLTATKAYHELSEHCQTIEQHFLAELRESRNDAVRLAGIVRQYLKDIDDTAALMKDEHPPQLTAEREALRQHEALHHQSVH